MKKKILTLIMILSSVAVMSQIYAPTPVSPANGASGIAPRVLLDWSTVPGAFTYKIEIDEDTLFGSPVQITSAYGAVYVNDLMYGTLHYWRIKAFGVTDSSDWSAVFTFTTTNKVTITYPVDSAEGRAVKPAFKWTSIAGSLNYDFEADTALTFDSPLYQTGSLAGTATTGYLKQLHFGEHYYLRLRARHSADTSGWSNIHNLWTLDSFALRKPANDTVAIMPVKAFFCDWAGAPEYDFAYSTDSTFASFSIFTADSLGFVYTSFDSIVRAFSPALNFNTTYFWMVRGRVPGDTSKWTEVRKFKTIECVSLTAPADAATDVSTLTTFSWGAITGALHYKLEVDTSAIFTNPASYVIASPATTYTLAAELIPQTNYHWRVSAVHANDSSSWCTGRSFKTGYGIGIEPELSSRNISIYPNPSRNGKINIMLAGQNSDVEIVVTDLFGQRIISDIISATDNNTAYLLDLSAKSNGIYFIQLRQGNETFTRKIVVNK